MYARESIKRYVKSFFFLPAMFYAFEGLSLFLLSARYAAVAVR
jgi:hypothetical protein